ncbi:penicillin acylase family protein [Streptomyces sp. ISL-10]|uniref:penicillin acylase family protein n=1 Tax=Streptomyces sp. ISL-10 TaxID=2819172 RepID=UPI0035ABCAEF
MTGPSGQGLPVVVRRIGHGMPHIVAEDCANPGFGTGWAQAADQVCVLADEFGTVRGVGHGRGERSRHFGPDAGRTARCRPPRSRAPRRADAPRGGGHGRGAHRPAP